MLQDLSKKTNGEIENLIDNLRKHGKTESEMYVEVLREHEIRRGKGLDLQKTLDLVINAARAGRFVAYKEIADINGFEWTKIHYQIGQHLFTLCEYAHRKGMPLLSAIVVNADAITTGKLKPESRAGFVEAARLLNFTVVDEEEFVAAEQKKVFAWACRGAKA